MVWYVVEISINFLSFLVDGFPELDVGGAGSLEGADEELQQQAGGTEAGREEGQGRQQHQGGEHQDCPHQVYQHPDTGDQPHQHPAMRPVVRRLHHAAGLVVVSSQLCH